MLFKYIKYPFSISVRTSTLPQQPTHHLKELQNSMKRIELELLTRHYVPQLIHRFDQLPLLKNYISYNEYLTTGGFDFEQFPLVKMLHIGLKLVEERNGDQSVWKNFQKIIKKRLHRCTTEQHMRLLYIMLRIWPFYKFHIDFITSICLGLKRQINIMNDDELKCLFRITSANRHTQEYFTGKILIDVQNSILSKVIEKWQKRLENLKGRILQFDNILLWICMGIPLAHRTNINQLLIQKKCLKLSEMFTILFREAIFRQIKIKSLEHQNVSLVLNFLSIFQPVSHLFVHNRSRKDENDWNNEYTKFKGSFLSFGKSQLEKLLLKNQNIQILSHFLTVFDSQTIESMLIVQNQIQSQTEIQNKRFPRITNQVHKLMSSFVSQGTRIERGFSLLCKILEKDIMNWQQVKLLYESLPFHDMKENNLDICFTLLKVELIFYSLSDKFQPNQFATTAIFRYLTENEVNWRNYDWLSFHFLRLLNENQNKGHLLTSNTHKDEQFHIQASNASKILSKLITQIKQKSSQKILEEEKKINEKDPLMLELKKFFTQVRLHQMQTLSPIIPYFNRLPQFSNKEKKISINAIKKDEINSPLVLLQKRLLNDIGWKVVNIEMPFWTTLTISQKLELIGNSLTEEERQINFDNKNLLE